MAMRTDRRNSTLSLGTMTSNQSQKQKMLRFNVIVLKMPVLIRDATLRARALRAEVSVHRNTGSGVPGHGRVVKRHTDALQLGKPDQDVACQVNGVRRLQGRQGVRLVFPLQHTSYTSTRLYS